MSRSAELPGVYVDRAPVEAAPFEFTRPKWHSRAACRTEKPQWVEVWFPPRGKNATEAKAICAGCPVVDECLDWAITHHERHGVRGGMDVKERRREAGRRRRARQARQAQ